MLPISFNSSYALDNNMGSGSPAYPQLSFDDSPDTFVSSRKASQKSTFAQRAQSAVLWAIGLLSLGTAGFLLHKSSLFTEMAERFGKKGGAAAKKGTGKASPADSGAKASPKRKAATGTQSSGSVSASSVSPPLSPKKSVEAATEKMTSALPETAKRKDNFRHLFPTAEELKVPRTDLKANTLHANALRTKQQEAFKQIATEDYGLTCDNWATGQGLRVKDTAKWQAHLDEKFVPKNISRMLRSLNHTGNTHLSDELMQLLRDNPTSNKKTALEIWTKEHLESSIDPAPSALRSSAPTLGTGLQKSNLQKFIDSNYPTYRVPGPAKTWVDDYMKTKGITGNPPVIGFYESNELGYVFSNTYNKELTFNGETFNTPEHALQMAKFAPLKQSNPTAYQEIKDHLSSLSGGSLQRAVKGYKYDPRDPNIPLPTGLRKGHYYTQSEWEARSGDTLTALLQARFQQHDEFRDLLQMAKDSNAIIVENAGKHDAWYGAGADGKGKNLLGLGIMDLYKQLP